MTYTPVSQRRRHFYPVERYGRRYPLCNDPLVPFVPQAENGEICPWCVKRLHLFVRDHFGFRPTLDYPGETTIREILAAGEATDEMPDYGHPSVERQWALNRELDAYARRNPRDRP